MFNVLKSTDAIAYGRRPKSSVAIEKNPDRSHADLRVVGRRKMIPQRKRSYGARCFRHPQFSIGCFSNLRYFTYMDSRRLKLLGT